jgi:putative restriction endonuclease
MKYWVGVTDNQWFHYLSALRPDELNFWQPGGKTVFSAIPQYAPFLFKLHSSQNYIVGGGFFVRHTFLPLSLAWGTFEQKNGNPDFDTFSDKIRKYRERSSTQRELDPVIGCIVLTSPFFLEKQDWIPVSKEWSPNIVQGKTYDTTDPIGQALWDQVSGRINVGLGLVETKAVMTDGESVVCERFGTEYLAKPRLGQGAFHVLVTEAYERRCAITGEKTLPVLNASHIKPFSKFGPHEVRNGLLLREDLHTLFDHGYLTVTEDHHVEVSRRIKEDYGNGREYYAMHRRKLLILPGREEERPAKEYLRWHNEQVYAS